MLLKELTQSYGVSGYESVVAQRIAQEITPLCDSLMVDAIGNLIAIKKGSGTGKKRIMVAAHMDEIGFCCVSITNEGFIKVKRMGGVSAHTSYMGRVRFTNGTVGVVAATPKFEDVKAGELDKLYIDIGATTREDAETLVQIGDVAGYIGEFEELAGGNLMSKSFDDRAGCYILIEALRKLPAPYHDLYFVFTVQEEVGLIGAAVAAERIRPQLGMAVDITGSFDLPSDSHGNAKLGGGAAIKVSDASVICDRGVVDGMIACAKQHSIPYQLDVLTGGGTDAGAINKSFQGVKCGGVSIPTRYGHSAHSVVNKKDLQSCIDLLAVYLSQPLELTNETVLKSCD